MKKNVKKIVALALVLLTLCIVPLSSLGIKASAATSGECGDDVTWEFDSYSGTLTISGTGNMGDWFANTPWSDFRKSIKHVVISEGVTGIGNYAFANLEVGNLYDTKKNPDSIISVSIADSVKRIGHHAFMSCNSLKEIDLPDNLITIGNYAFHSCSSLESVEIPKNLKNIGDGIYSYMLTLERVSIPSYMKTTPIAMFNCSLGLKEVHIEYGVETISRSTFGDCNNIETLYLPKSLKNIESSAFNISNGGASLYDIYYEGSESDWAQIEIGEYNEVLSNATIHYNYKPTTGFVPDYSYDEYSYFESNNNYYDNDEYYKSDEINNGDEYYKGDEYYTTNEDKDQKEPTEWWAWLLVGLGVVGVLGVAFVVVTVVVVVIVKKRKNKIHN